MIDAPTFEGGLSAYEVLGVEPDVDAGALRSAYRKLIVVSHPDRVSARGGSQAEVEAATARTAELTAAYQLLSDETARADYDRLLAQPEPEPEVDLDEGFVDDEILSDPEPGHEQVHDLLFDADAGAWADAEVVEDWAPGQPGAPHQVSEPPEAKVVRRSGLAIPLGVAAVLALAAVGAWQTPPAGSGALLHQAGAIALGYTGIMVAAIAWSRHGERNRVLAWKGLKPGFLYGQLPPDPQAGRLHDDVVDPVVASVPGTFAVRCSSEEAPFSHAVVRGDRAAFVRGVAVPPGIYYWQGGTLVGIDPAGDRFAYATVDWESQQATAKGYRKLASVQQVVLFGGGLTVRHGTGPMLLRAAEAQHALISFLAGTAPVVDHRRGTEATSALLAWARVRRTGSGQGAKLVALLLVVLSAWLVWKNWSAIAAGASDLLGAGLAALWPIIPLAVFFGLIMLVLLDDGRW